MFDDTLRDARQLCSDLGLEPNALDFVFSAQGWQFFVQGSALLEAAINHALTQRVIFKKSAGQVDSEKVSRFLERLPMRGRVGRIALLDMIEFFPEPMLAQIEAFFTIRNAYAHDIRLLNVDCASLLHQLPESERNRIVKVMVTNPLAAHLLPEQKPVDLVEGVAHLMLLAHLSWITKFKQPQGGLLSQVLGFGARSSGQAATTE